MTESQPMDNLKLERIFARNCSVRRIGKETAERFISENHSMGWASCRYCYALVAEKSTGRTEFHPQEKSVVAVATFSSSRRIEIDGCESRSFEWIRYASLNGTRVVGGMGKLLEAFIQDKHPGDIMTYADASSSRGDAYMALGFEFEKIVEKPGIKNYKFRKRIAK